jgi:hypothetical protein
VEGVCGGGFEEDCLDGVSRDREVEVIDFDREAGALHGVSGYSGSEDSKTKFEEVSPTAGPCPTLIMRQGDAESSIFNKRPEFE